MKKSATQGFTKTGQPGLTRPTGSYAPGNQQSHLINILLASFAWPVRQVMDPRFFFLVFIIMNNNFDTFKALFTCGYDQQR